MARLGPWDPARRVAVAVSGGADSLALALLTAAWGAPTAFIVDHGLRAGSAAEAEQTAAALTARGIDAILLNLSGLHPGAGMPARARAARYGALEAAAAAAGLVDLLLGHHAGDQAETVAMRQERGSGGRGLAGMAAVSEGALVRRVRPLLGVAPERLRATLRAAGIPWVEDPTNADPAYTRARLRGAIGEGRGVLLAMAAHHAQARTAADAAIAQVLAERAAIFPEGYALLTPGPILPAALAQLLQAISGRAFAPSPGAVAALAADLRPATLGGVEIRPDGRLGPLLGPRRGPHLGPGWLLVREAAAMAPAAALQNGAVWDGRVRVVQTGLQPGATLGALGAEAAEFRGCGLPSAVLRTLPAVRREGVLCAVQLPAYIAHPAAGPEILSEIILRHDVSPACGAPFMA